VAPRQGFEPQLTSTYRETRWCSTRIGETRALAKNNGTVAVTSIDLNRRYDDDWLGNMRERFMKELRLDVR
jgi:hypothetical protein